MKTTEQLKITWHRLRPLFSGSRAQMIALGVSAFLGGVAEAAVLLVIVKLALVIAGGDSVTALAVGPVSATLSISSLFVAAFSLAAARLALQGGSSYVSARMSADVVDHTRRGAFSDFIGASWALQSKEEEGHLHDLLHRHVARTASAVLNVSTGLNALFNFTALLLTAFVLNVVAASLIIVAVLVLFLVLRPITRLTRQFAAIQSEAGLRYSKSMVETVGMTMELRTFDVLDEVTEQMHALSKEEIEPFFKANFVGKFLAPAYQTAAMVVLLSGMVAVHLFVDSELGSLGAVVLILVRALNYSEGMQMTYHRIVEVMPFAERLQSERQRFRDSTVAPGEGEVPALRSLAFDHVSFAYVPDRLALDDIHLELQAGEAVGIVGPSGSGKSTLVQLLLRLREPTEGRFLVNGTDARGLELRGWFRRIAFVPQDSRLMSASVTDNIRFLRDDLDDEAIANAARLAHVHDEIMAWPQQYETMVGPRGNAISGGQRQRIALARALAGHPDLIVLDEPTSALDMQSEALVHRTLAELKGKVTLVIVAHRLSTLNICDRIMVLGDGRLQAFDYRERLEQDNTFYREALALSKIQ